jgi:hypothetical protein
LVLSLERGEPADARRRVFALEAAEAAGQLAGEREGLERRGQRRAAAEGCLYGTGAPIIR